MAKDSSSKAQDTITEKLGEFTGKVINFMSLPKRNLKDSKIQQIGELLGKITSEATTGVYPEKAIRDFKTLTEDMLKQYEGAPIVYTAVRTFERITEPLFRKLEQEQEMARAISIQAPLERSERLNIDSEESGARQRLMDAFTSTKPKSQPADTASSNSRRDIAENQSFNVEEADPGAIRKLILSGNISWIKNEHTLASAIKRLQKLDNANIIADRLLNEVLAKNKELFSRLFKYCLENNNTVLATALVNFKNTHPGNHTIFDDVFKKNVDKVFTLLQQAVIEGKPDIAAAFIRLGANPEDLKDKNKLLEAVKSAGKHTNWLEQIVRQVCQKLNISVPKPFMTESESKLYNARKQALSIVKNTSQAPNNTTLVKPKVPRRRVLKGEEHN